MSKSHKRSDSLKRKHWSIKACESLICRNVDGHFCLNVEGGAESGLMPFVGEIRQDKIHYQNGKLHHGDIILEVNSKRVPGMIKKDVIALIKRSADPVSLLTVKQNATITRDVRQYLATRFTKNSVDSELQHQIRENLHLRVVPCTTRQPQDGERQGIDYNFISVETFKRMDKAGELLESGVYEANYYGTPKPPSDPPSSTMIPAYSRSTAATGYSKEAILPSDSLSAPRPGGRGPPHLPMPKTVGPLPANWEIAYTENNEKYFIDHSTGTTHWLDPRLARHMKHNMMECAENELPYGWEKVNDPVYGTYFIDHVSRATQYENPVNEAKRRFAGSQLPQRGPPPGAYHGPPPLREPPPTIQSAAALEKQREAEAAAMWPDAGLADNPDSYPYPYPQQQQQHHHQQHQQQPNEHDLEAELHGEVIHVGLQKTASGFGFTIIGGDRPGELLQIKSIVRGSVADRDGRLQVGDVLVRINGISVLTYSHRKVVDLFQSLPLNSEVSVEVRRGYPLQDFRGDELPSYNESSHGYNGDYPPQDSYNPPQAQQQPEKVSVNIVKGPLGFGFSLGESEMGPVVKQIMDHPRCAQLQEGDVLMEVNGERVRSYTHSDLVTVLKRCPKGNQALFVVYRQPVEELPSYSGPEGYPPPQMMGSDGPFTIMEVRLMRQVSGFGFRIIGGEEEGSQATVGAIVAGGAADLDGRMQIGDEITHINGCSVVNASHRDVIGLMGEAAAQGEVVLGIRRKMPMTDSVPPPGSYGGPVPNQQYQQHGGHDMAELEEPQSSLPQGSRNVTVDRPNIQTSFGFVLQSNTLRAGCMICRLVPDSPAEKCNQLYMYDELLAVNGKDVSRMDHGDIVALIKSSGLNIHLAVQQPEDLELINRQQMIEEQQQQTDGWGQQGPPQGGYQEDRGNFQDYPGMEDDGAPQISADLSDIASDDEEIHHIDIRRSGGGFGFSIRGGAEYNSPLCVLRIADGGAAVIDGRLRVGDELLEINGNNTESMLHSDAITIIKHGGDVVKLIIRRVPDEPFIGSGKSGHGQDGTVFSPTAVQTKDRYNQEYLNSLSRNRDRSYSGGGAEHRSPPNE